MKPQPPVTRKRIAARTSSAGGGALADFPAPGNQLATRKTWFSETAWVPWLILGLAIFLRFFLLDIKPAHFDEGINGWFVDQMMKTGFYRYDPTNYHGPLHFYVLLLAESLFGRNIWALRLPVVLVSIGCVWLSLKFEPLVGRNVSRIAALAMAVSPGFVFYGRYSIHEVWLVLFSMMFILGLLGLWKFGTTNYLWWAGMGAAGMILTKETYIIHLVCAVVAIPVLLVSHALNRLPDARLARQTWTYLDLLMVIGVGAAAIVFFYSGTFLNWSGVKGLYQTFPAWAQTGQAGHGHEKSWYYWLGLMWCYEWPVLLAGLPLCLLLPLCLFCQVFCQAFKNLSLRYLAIYGVGVLALYSYVPYKTPWCIINIVWPFLFTFGAAALLVSAKHRGAIYVLLAVPVCCSLGASISLNYFRCTTDTEPYVYVQTYNDIFKLTKPLLQLAKRDPANYHLTGHLIRSSTYPLPWILGDFTHIGYYEHGNLPKDLDAAFLLVQEDKINEVESKLRNAYYTEPLRIRNYQDTSKLYLSAEIFKEFFPGRSPDFVGKGPG
jgi:uncharacterized protein (TIGR03663 family)